MKYKIAITETLQTVIEVDSSDKEEALIHVCNYIEMRR